MLRLRAVSKVVLNSANTCLAKKKLHKRFNLLKLLAISTVWILKCFTSLPKLYLNKLAKISFYPFLVIQSLHLGCFTI